MEAIKKDEFTVSISSSFTSWKILKIESKAPEDGIIRQVRWQIPAKKMYFEYLCFPKYYAGHIRLKMSEEKNLFLIEGPEKILLDGQEALRFISREKVPLRKKQNYKVQLWEIRDSGDRLLYDMLPCPVPSNRSLLRPYDTITSYNYF